MHVLNQNIRDGQFITKRARYQALTSSAKNLIEGLICKDVTKRLTIPQALKHPWFVQSGNDKISDDSGDSESSASDLSVKNEQLITEWTNRDIRQEQPN